MRVYWCNIPNFGDRLSAPLLRKFAGIEAEWSSAAGAELICVGSVLQKAPRRFTGIVLGTGFMYERNVANLREARVLAVRGPHTARRVKGVVPEHLGDPGILADLLVDGRPEVEHEVAVIPHRIDQKLRAGGHLVDLGWPVEKVIEETARCERVITSSLHGLILADALELPRRWQPHPQVHGAGFKFRDYALALGQHIRPGEWMSAPPAARENMRVGLLEAFACVTTS